MTGIAIMLIGLNFVIIYHSILGLSNKLDEIIKKLKGETDEH